MSLWPCTFWSHKGRRRFSAFRQKKWTAVQVCCSVEETSCQNLCCFFCNVCWVYRGGADTQLFVFGFFSKEVKLKLLLETAPNASCFSACCCSSRHALLSLCPFEHPGQCFTSLQSADRSCCMCRTSVHFVLLFGSGEKAKALLNRPQWNRKEKRQTDMKGNWTPPNTSETLTSSDPLRRETSAVCLQNLKT